MNDDARSAATCTRQFQLGRTFDITRHESVVDIALRVLGTLTYLSNKYKLSSVHLNAWSTYKFSTGRQF